MGLANAQHTKKFSFFGKKLPAWVLLAALVAVGAGAATGLVLKDQIDGTTTIAVSQALTVTSVASSGGDDDEFLGTIDDDGMTWAAHFEANNGDVVDLQVTVTNGGGSDSIVAILTLDVPEGITVSIDSEATQCSANQWKFDVTAGGTEVLDFDFALEDALATGFYTITGTIEPVNV